MKRILAVLIFALAPALAVAQVPPAPPAPPAAPAPPKATPPAPPARTPLPPKPPMPPKPRKGAHVHVDLDDDDADLDLDFNLDVDIDEHGVPHFRLDGKQVDIHEITQRAMELAKRAEKVGEKMKLKWGKFGPGHGGGGRTNPAPVKVKGPVRLHAESMNDNFEVTAGAATEVSAACDGGGVSMSTDDDEVNVDVDWPGSCRGPIKIAVPAGSSVELSTTNGNVKLAGSYGDVEIEAVGGNINVDKAADVRVEAVSGKVRIGDAGGRVQVETTSGTAEIGSSSPAPRLEYETTSGDLVWRGTCGKGCRIEANSFSGNVDLGLDKKSSFGVRFNARSGDVKDGLGIKIDRSDKEFGSVRLRGSYGTGEGSVKVETYSGTLKLTPR